MKVTHNLNDDHRIIEIALPALERLGRHAQQLPTVDSGAAEMALGFLHTFVDVCHHGKEERHLFAALERRGIPRDEGFILHLLRDHGEGRRHVRTFSRHIAAALAGDQQAGGHCAAALLSYVSLLRHHIAEEDAELWPLTERALSVDDDSRLAGECAEVDRVALGTEGRAGYRSLAERIARSVP